MLMKSLLTILFVTCSFVISCHTASSRQTPEAIKMEKVARRHMQDERKNFKQEEIQKAEELYTMASELLRNGGNPETLLDSVVSMYPQFDRAGCAQLYRAQLEKGQEKESLLKDCITRFSNCYYGDGAQVGPLAMLQLAEYDHLVGKEQDAQELVERLRKEYSESVGHDGVLLVDKINK